MFMKYGFSGRLFNDIKRKDVDSETYVKINAEESEQFNINSRVS